jgi:hypothetical protein
VHPPPVRGPAQPGVELVDRLVQGAVEVARTRLGADHRTAGDAGDLDALAVVRLAGIALVLQFDAHLDELLIVAFDLLELLRYVHSIMVGYLDVATLDDNVHA